MRAGDQHDRNCSRCKRPTMQVRDVGPGYAGWICSRCMQFDADAYRWWHAYAWVLTGIAVLLALAVKAILTHVPPP